MSDLTKAIEANTAAVLALTAVLTTGGPRGNPVYTPPLPAGTPKLPPEPKALEYLTDVRPFAVKLNSSDKPKLLALLATYKVERATELKAEQLEAFLADVKAALGE